jgi:hypothetical protein
MHYECIKNTFKNENKTVLCMHVEYVLNAFQNGKRVHFWCMLHNACYIFFFHLQYIINACRHAKILLGKLLDLKKIICLTRKRVLLYSHSHGLSKSKSTKKPWKTMSKNPLSSHVDMEKSWTSKGLQLLFHIFFGPGYTPMTALFAL